VEGTRVDQWLWAIRVYKTRTLATDSCRGGHVRVRGAAAKPATTVEIGDLVEARVHGRKRVVEVVRPVAKRVGPAVATECYIDHSPPPPPSESVRPLFPRERGSGRPSKRDRRVTDRFRTS